MIAEPPFAAGAVHVTDAEESPTAAVTPVGAPGRSIGVTLFDGVDAGPVPAAFVAVTVNVYVVPSISPVTVVLVPAVLVVTPPGDDVTV